jgi:hypothetical protein
VAPQASSAPPDTCSIGPATGGGDPDGLDYAGGLTQRTCLAISRAADDLDAVFGPRAADVGALFTVWATREARACAQLLRRHALSPFAAAAGLPATVQCVSLALVFVYALEKSHSLSVSAPFAAELWPHIEAVTKRHLRRVGEELKVNAQEEVALMAMQAAMVTGQKQAGPRERPRVELATGGCSCGWPRGSTHDAGLSNSCGAYARRMLKPVSLLPGPVHGDDLALSSSCRPRAAA